MKRAKVTDKKSPTSSVNMATYARASRAPAAVLKNKRLLVILNFDC